MNDSNTLLHIASFLQAICFIRGYVCAYRLFSDESGKHNESVKENWVFYIITITTLKIFEGDFDKILSLIKQGNALALVFEALDQLTVLLGSDRPDDTADSTIEDNAKLTEKDASFPVPLGVIEGINQFVKAIPRENKSEYPKIPALDNRHNDVVPRDRTRRIRTRQHETLNTNIRDQGQYPQYPAQPPAKNSITMLTTTSTYAKAMKEARRKETVSTQSVRAIPVELIAESICSKTNFTMLKGLLRNKGKSHLSRLTAKKHQRE